MNITKNIASALSLNEKQVKSTIELFDQGATIPFISRYRKEMTGNLDEVQIQDIKKLREDLIALEKRKERVINIIEEQGKLNAGLKKNIQNATTLNEVEDLYLPFKQKKKTRAEKARKRGLEPLSKLIFAQKTKGIEKEAGKFLGKEVKTAEDALQGARDIIAEDISQSHEVRNRIRKIFEKEALIRSKVIKKKKAEAEKYTDYFAWEELLRKSPSHRILAIFRGEKEGFLRVDISPPDEPVFKFLTSKFITGNHTVSSQMQLAVYDSYKRLLQPSLANEFRNKAKERADDEAIKVFAENLEQLLMAPPLGQKRVLAIDPGFKTGCKVVCLDEQGKLIHNETIYPHPPQKQKKAASKKISTLVNSHKIEAIAVGNGTAGRETEQFIKKIKFDRDLKVFIVNENGASVYSASKTAREEFPDYDVTVRGTVSIGRRLMDPLAELVKIDPQSIGVGQYQHDVDQKRLKEGLDQVVENCVNRVGVNLNTASKHLLSYVSGLGPQLAENIIQHRNDKGAFQSREKVKVVHRMGDKAFEQAAGFLRIPNADNPLDNTAVHPESYHIVENMAADQNCKAEDLIKEKKLRDKIKLEKYVSGDTGLPTLQDIMKELDKPGRDPRKAIRVFEFDENIRNIEDLKPGMELPGIITNITNFGAFVDIGIKENGLIHISNLSDEYVKNPGDVVSLNQHVKVKVINIDIERKRIGLSLSEV